MNWVELSRIRIREISLWFCPVKKRWKTSGIWPQLKAVATRRFQAVFLRFFLRICLIFPNLVKLIEISRHHFHRPSYLHRTGEFQFCRFYIFRTYRTTFNRSRENTEIQHFVDFLKDSIRMKLRSGVDVWYVAVTALPCSILLVSLNDPPFNFLSYGQKMDPSSELNRFLSANRGFGKSQFF